MKPRSSSQVGIVWVLMASKTISSALLISTNAVTGPAGPLAKAVCTYDLPHVSRILPTMPIKNRYLLKGATYGQYQHTPISKTKVEVTTDEPKMAVFG